MIIYIFENYKNRNESTVNLAKKAVIDFLRKENYSLDKIENITIEKTKEGKPYAKDLPIFLSISHSENICIIGISLVEIGVDIEKIREINYNQIAKRYFMDKEIKHINETPNKDEFFRIWTRKEAYAKMLGIPVLKILKTISAIEGNNVRDIHFEEIYIKKGFISSVCIKKKEKVSYERK